MSVAEPETEWAEDENGGGTGNDGGDGGGEQFGLNW